jgi:hypothetical protein
MHMMGPAVAVNVLLVLGVPAGPVAADYKPEIA